MPLKPLNQIINPALGTFGGPTPTIAIQPRGPAVDAITDGTCTVKTDQRGIVRPQDGNGDGGPACDIGSFERRPPAPVFCGLARATIVGTQTGEVIKGTVGRDVIAALGGNDFIAAFSGNDIVCAGVGADVVYGGPGNDLLRGGAGNDRIIGVTGNDRILGEQGNDRMDGGLGFDTCNGGINSDRNVGNRCETVVNVP